MGAQFVEEDGGGAEGGVGEEVAVAGVEAKRVHVAPHLRLDRVIGYRIAFLQQLHCATTRALVLEL